MKKEKAYCQLCDKDVDYILKEEEHTTTINNITFTFTFLRALCKHCGEDVFPVLVTKINETSVHDAYKKKAGLLTSNEIIAVRKKMGLTQEGLAKLMGCGLKTITRYENGSIQDKAFDNFIRCLDELYDLKFLNKKEQDKNNHKSIFDKIKRPRLKVSFSSLLIY